MKARYLRFMMKFCMPIIWFACLTSLHPSSREERNPWSALLYAGIYTSTDLLPILFRQKTDYRNSMITVAGLNYSLASRLRMFRFEAEGLFGKHTGLMDQFEADGLLIARIHDVMSLPLSVAIGEGLSIASKNPSLENQSKGIYPGGIHLDSIESRSVLNYLMVEMDYGLPLFQERNPRLFVRIHHRSGVFGLYCPPDPACGSNFVSYGMKWSL